MTSKGNKEQNRRLNKKGTYILEASLVLPAFFIAMILLISVIPVVASAENALFVMGDELRVAGIKAAFTEETISTPVATAVRLSGESGDARITNYSQDYSKGGIDELIAMEVSVYFSGKNPLDGRSRFLIRQRVMARAFTGADNSGGSGIADYENSHIVYVFPNYGEKYHDRNCYFLNPSPQRVILTSDIRRQFGACSNCHSGSASLGSTVYCFFNSGKVYHLGNCSAVDKFYVEMEEKDAEARGYTPCGSCGG